jgi:hypothetical protein
MVNRTRLEYEANKGCNLFKTRKKVNQQGLPKAQ